MKTFDLLSNPNARASQKTWFGGVITLISFMILCWLMRNEYAKFTENRVTKTIFVDNISRGSTVDFTLSIKLRNAPCSILSVDLEDSLEHHVADVPFVKVILNKNGIVSGIVF